MNQYGLPYMGSKQRIAIRIIKLFPSADHFYDLFGGGFSITHAMLLHRSKAFKKFHFNEIKSDIVDLIKKSITGEYSYERFKPNFITSDEFKKRLDDPYIRVCWSFGNNQKGYLFSKQIEPYKHSMHNAVVFNRFDELAEKVFGHNGFRDGYSVHDRRLFLRSRIGFYRKHGIPDFLKPFLNENLLQELEQLDRLERLEQLEQLQTLQQLKQLERLQQLERLERLQLLQQSEQLEFSSKSYDEIEIKENSIVYCDPPYKMTADYGGEFDHDRFLDWCDKQTSPVFISEYNIEDDRFKIIKTIKKAKNLNNSTENITYALEKVYVNKSGWDKISKRVRGRL